MDACRSIHDAIENVDTRDRGTALLTGQACYYGGDKLSHLELYKALRKIDLLCERKHIDLEFIPESEKLDLYTSSAVATLYPARLSKVEFLQFAKIKHLLPYKTTRHVVPLRPMGLYFPLRLLKNGSLSDCKKELERIVKFSKVRIERKNLWYEGR